jgi:hypothetical protein
MKTIVELTRAAGGFEPTPEFLERLVAVARADEREAVIGFLRGINETETESEDGWWETSTGAEFGARILAAIRARGDVK